MSEDVVEKQPLGSVGEEAHLQLVVLEVEAGYQFLQLMYVATWC